MIAVSWAPIGHGLNPVDVARFTARVDVSGGLHACWPWLGPVAPHGYGRTQRNGTAIPANRFALEIALGRPIRDGYFACHTCDNKACCNPRHLYEGTPADNTRDAMERGLWSPPSTFARRPRPDEHVRGTQVNTAKLTEADIRSIRSAPASTPNKELAARFGVHNGTISRIRRRRTWRHVQ